jgi:hypothetical protein
MTVVPDMIIFGTDQIGEASGELTERNKITPAPRDRAHQSPSSVTTPSFTPSPRSPTAEHSRMACKHVNAAGKS